MVALLVGLLACKTTAKLPEGDPSRPDIVLVSVDTLRADHLSCYGHDRPTSPFLDGLAAAGTRYADARSPAPWTLPAHTTLLTGLLPQHHQVVEDSLHLDPATPLLAEVMKGAGYATGGAVATLYVSTIYGFDRGFNHFEDFDLHTEKQNLRGEVLAADVVDDALAWLSRLPPKQPFFLFLHVYDVHYLYDPPKPWATLFDRAPKGDDPKYKNYFYSKKHPLNDEQWAHQKAQYDEAIRYVDDQLARLSQALSAAGRAPRWAVTADHGEEHGERGGWGHAHTLYNEQLHVPLILSGPGLPAGQVEQSTVGLQDVAPTLARWVGATLPGDGVDLGQGAPPDRAFPAETSRFTTNRVGLYEGGLRLEWDLSANRRELYDDRADPTEQKDLAKGRPEDLARLTARVEALLGAPWRASSAGRLSTEGAVLSGGLIRPGPLAAGQRFLVLPWDAAVSFQPDGGAVAGPWAAAGGARPGPSDPLQIETTARAGETALDPAARERLEALGYLQEEPPR